jgi:hypothetical protein
VASFPVLKTGVVAQYPLDRTRQFSTQVHRFLEGSEQRFPGFGAPLRQWSIRLDLLDEGELEGLEQFFLEQEGRSGNFSFTDPWDGTVYPNCSCGGDELVAVFQGQGGGTLVLVKENR